MVNWQVVGNIIQRGVYLSKKAIKIKVYAPKDTGALEDMQSLIEFLDDFPEWNCKPEVEFFVEKSRK